MLEYQNISLKITYFIININLMCFIPFAKRVYLLVYNEINGPLNICQNVTYYIELIEKHDNNPI